MSNALGDVHQGELLSRWPEIRSFRGTRSPWVQNGTGFAMHLNKQTTDSIKLLVVCARASEGSLTKVADAAEQVGLTKQNGLKLANGLAKLGLVETMRGRSGGIRLLEAPEEIRLGRVVRLLEDYWSQRQGRPDETGPLDLMLDAALASFYFGLDQNVLSDLSNDADTPANRICPAADLLAAALAEQ
ncbi:MAG: Rrf2 family transcriptional regulator [Pseudomonadota bacterium]